MDGFDLEGFMELNLVKYSSEIVDFFSAQTLEEIDYGILDLSKIKDLELREVLRYFEELLTLELKQNYMENETGIFRVHIFENKYCYKEFEYIIESASICELKEWVLAENRIWYVFDEILANEKFKR